MDYAKPIDNYMLLVVVGAFSKWIEVFPVKAASSVTTIGKLRALFATHGIPKSIVSDNGSPFTSSEMKEFLIAKGVKQITSSPYHPSSNGLAEWAVQTCKSALKKMDGASLDVKLQCFLLNYRTTPQGTTGIPPSQFLMVRQLRTCLDQVIPDLSQKHYHDKHTIYRNFAPVDHILVRNYADSPHWLPGIVETVLGQFHTK